MIRPRYHQYQQQERTTDLITNQKNLIIARLQLMAQPILQHQKISTSITVTKPVINMLVKI